jgi:radical SAM superfamily enzyme YgiQ (UPF0313 family)
LGRVALIATYEMGRQPFGLASPAAWLCEAGARVSVQDLAVSHIDMDAIRNADLVGFFVPMHTATKLALRVYDQVRLVNPDAHVCFYGLYAPLNKDYLLDRGVGTVLGGEFESDLVDLYHATVARANGRTVRSVSVTPLPIPKFKVPDRSSLPGLASYAHLDIGNGEEKVVGYTEATRGCRHLCRHCPVVPVYAGRFVVVPPDIVIEDVRRQVAGGADHITFGDPDFFNGPAHAMRIVRRIHEEFPGLTYDVTVKVEHLAKHARLIPTLKATGCVLVTSAVESFDDVILEKFDKRHTADEFESVLAEMRIAGLALNATFVAFTPWTTVLGYGEFLRRVEALGLIDGVAPIQYAIRLLVTNGSGLLDLPEINTMIGPFDDGALMYPWTHTDPAVDKLQRSILRVVETGQAAGLTRRQLFSEVWDAARDSGGLDIAPPISDVAPIATIPFLTEPWFC